MTDPVANDRSAGYVDLQVNGYAGIDFNGNDLTAERLHEACCRLESDGVAGILATVITDQVDRMAARLARLAMLRESDRLAQKIIWGVHIEGPFIWDQPGFVGAHPPTEVCPASPEKMQRLLDAAGGLTRIVTLAPEHDASLVVTRMLSDKGICVSAGHCDPSLDQLNAAIDAGLSMFTHLGNGCPSDLPRHDNIIQRALSRSDRLWISFIADGVHVPWPALGNYIKAAGFDRSIVVTDAISAAGLGPGEFSLGDSMIMVDEDGATWSADRSHLAGSSATMPQIKTRLQQKLRLTEDEVAQLICRNPRQVVSTDSASEQ
jgi:N-acetylglucosamine-6-phosphate deacetylase